MKINKNDYLVCLENKKEFLCRAMEDSNGDVSAYLEKDCHIPNKRTLLTVAKKQILINLGQNPNPGKLYGLDVANLYRGRKDHEHFGAINFFYKPKDKQIAKDLWIAMDKVHRILAKKGLTFLLDDLVWEVLSYNKEKYAGMYFEAKNDKMPSRIQILPESMSASDYIYIYFHELGHHLHLQYVTSKKLNALWLKVYNTSIKVETIKKEVSVRLLNELLDQEDLPSDFKGQLSEEDTLAFKWIIRAISSNNSLSIKELDILFEAGMKDEIKKIWPQRTLTHKELAPVLTEYATRNVRELIAESFAYYMSGKKMPEGLIKLIEKSISYAKANRS